MNSISSNESEVIGNNDYLPYNIWYEYLLEARGSTKKSNMLWEDNDAEEKMAKNRKFSCSSKSRHIIIKFFWVVDREKQGKISVKHCPTKKCCHMYSPRIYRVAVQIVQKGDYGIK